ncbi:MAG: hypothetical protein ACRC1Z_25440 [Waterburya sp.]
MLNKLFPNQKPQKLAIGSTLITLVALYTLGWHIFTGTPRYSLGQLQEAIEKNQIDEIEDYIDVQSLANQVIDTTFDSVYQSLPQQTSSSEDVLGQLSTSLGLGIMESMRPMIQQQIETYFSEAIRQPSQAGLKQMKLTSINQAKDGTVIATFDISQVPNNQVIQLKSIGVVLEQQPTRQWKIMELDKETLKAVVATMD